MGYQKLIENFSAPLDLTRSDLSAQIAGMRAQIESHDAGIFKSRGNFTDLPGLCRIKVDDIAFGCLFIPGAEKTLHVAFTGAKRPDHDYFANPGISRWTYYKMFNGYLLGLNDPMYLKYPELSLGWYYGDNDRFYIRAALQAVKKVAEMNGIRKDDITFFSSSGGGYAALMASLMLPGTLSLSLNPQIFIGNWEYAGEFRRITGIDLKRPDPFHRNDPLPLLHNSKSHHLICFNAASQEDVDTQLLPLAKALDMKLRYGLNKKGRLLLWLYDAPGAPSAHTAFETKAIFAAMEELGRAFKDSEDFDIDTWQPVVLMINEIWHDLYESKSENYESGQAQEKERDAYLAQLASLHALIREKGDAANKDSGQRLSEI